MRLTPAQIGLQVRNSMRPRRTVRFCGTCGGKHSGGCNLVSTSHGTRCRPEILEKVEARFREAVTV